MPASTLDIDALLPTAADVAWYGEHGFWISPVILSDAVLDAAERGMARFHAGERDRPYPGESRLQDDGWVPGRTGLRKNDYTSQQVDELARLVRVPAIGAIAARLSGAAGIRLWHDQLLWKPTEADGVAANVGWHTDAQYWQVATSDSMLTAWVPFHDVDATTGSITFIDGSHRWQVDGLDFWNGDLDALTAQLEAAGHDVTVVPARLRRGQVSFHHCRSIHGSGPNRSGGPRRSIALHLQPAGNAFRVGADESSHRNAALAPRTAAGHPDFADGTLFPTLWPVG